MDRILMILKINLPQGFISPNPGLYTCIWPKYLTFIGIYIRSQVSVYRTTGIDKNLKFFFFHGFAAEEDFIILLRIETPFLPAN